VAIQGFAIILLGPERPISNFSHIALWCAQRHPEYASNLTAPTGKSAPLRPSVLIVALQEKHGASEVLSVPVEQGVIAVKTMLVRVIVVGPSQALGNFVYGWIVLRTLPAILESEIRNRPGCQLAEALSE
jgi:hypothetical protein